MTGSLVDFSNLPSLRTDMSRHGIVPKKSLGQNFLLDQNITEKIVRFAAPLSGKNVLEIGPGPGGLTRAILSAGVNSLTVIEKDTSCLALLNELAAHCDDRLVIRNEDALKVSLESLAPAPDHIIANLPYNVATPLLVRWLNSIHQNASVVQSMTLMFQKEVADRIYAAPGGKTYGRLGLLTQWLCHVEPCFELPPHVFTPAPKVTSTVVRFIPRDKPLFPAQFGQVEDLAQTLFSQRRKMIRQTLKKCSADVSNLLAKADLDGTRRAETLEPLEFGRLLKALS